ncbi:MAG: hypothetical protein DRO09_03580, partial [Thermoprotei archaeon]
KPKVANFRGHMAEVPICIVVPTYFAGDILKRVLHSIVELEYPKELMDVYVIATPHDKEAELHVKEVREAYQLKIQFITTNMNASAMRNYGIRLCRYRYVIVVDDDVLLAPGLVRRAMEIMGSDDRVAAVGYPVLSTEPALHERIGHGKFIGIVTDSYTVMPCTLFNKDILMKVGLYREDMGPPLSIHEDWELASRIRRHGYRVIVDGTITLKHLWNLTKRKKSRATTTNAKKRHSSRLLGVSSLGTAFLRYCRGYINRNWWSMLQVLKVSPLSQLLEYIYYTSVPFIVIATGIAGQFLMLMLIVLLTLVFVELNTIFKGYYRGFSIDKRLTYPLMLTAIRFTRLWLTNIAAVYWKLKELGQGVKAIITTHQS